MSSKILTAVIGLSLGVAALAIAPVASSGERLDGQDCASLFKQLNASGSGQLTATEAAANPIAAKAFDDPAVQQKGYLTEEEFTGICQSQPSEAPQSGQ